MPNTKLTQFIVHIPYFIPLLFIPFLLLDKIRKHLKRFQVKNRRELLTRTRPQVDQVPPIIIGYFHPYCDAGGGGERVLWKMIETLQSSHPNTVHAVYTGDLHSGLTKEQMLSNVKTRFNIDLQPDTIDLIPLQKRKWVESSTYPRFTMVGQSLGSLVLGWEAMTKLIPDVYFDTMGYAFTYPLVKLIAQTKVAAYVHYPTISTDMLQSVQSRDTNAVNNQSSIVTRSSFLTTIKLVYYKLFAFLYGHVGGYADLVMVNSSWTQGHIQSLWGSEVKAKVLFPPCDTEQLVALPPHPKRLPHLLSIAQFRPEKNHALQLQALAELFVAHPKYKACDPPVKLIMLGSVRHAEDQARVDQLKRLAQQLSIEEQVEFVINAPFAQLQEYLSQSLVGLHTMANEHFGIGVVEFLAAGVIPIAHSSGGPQMDIISWTTGHAPLGFLASEPSQYAQYVDQVLTQTSEDPDKVHQLRLANQASADQRFSNRAFEAQYRELILPLIDPNNTSS